MNWPLSRTRYHPFPNAEAKALLKQELGTEKYNQLGIDRQTQACRISVHWSSLQGQNRRQGCCGKGSASQRVAEIALDLYIVRELCPTIPKITNRALICRHLANEWGRGFIGELDYREEAAATTRFSQEMEKRNLNAVCAPTVVPEYSTTQILTTEWVDGTRLDESDQSDVPRLCAVALNAYLVMLLELKSLHCDPHPVRCV